MGIQEQRYLKRLGSIQKLTDGDFILSAGDFQCPYSGKPCIIYWDTEKYVMWAEVLRDEETMEETFEWCNDFNKQYAESAHEANSILKKWLESEYIYYCFQEES